MGDRSKSCSFVILCVLAVGCPSLLRADSPEQVSVTVGEEFTVKLASNPTTGYSWALAGALPSWLVQVNQAYIADTSGLAGAGGTEHWTFRATAAGSATLTLQYERPWEGTPAETHVCQVTARLPTDTEYIFVATGQDFTLALASNPSTGYSWTLAGSLPSWLQQVGKTYVAADPGLLGGGGTDFWTFHATATGSATLIFQYGRPSDSTPGKVRVCQVTAAAPADRENIFVAAGDNFTVALASNPTTGYSWTPAASLPGWLQQVSQTYVAANPGTIGGGGTEYWTFQAAAAGSANLVFQYERPWEGTPAQTHVSQVTATAPTDKDSIFVATGENFMVALASNPSTGYSWTLAGSLPSWLKQVGKTYVAANPGLLGEIGRAHV
jgi:inhibitor of cysteine peptidase